MLSHKFLETYKAKYNKSGMHFSAAALKQMENYHWPGNIRELMHTIERAVVLNDNEITPLSLNLNPETEMNDGLALPSLKLDEVEKYCIVKALSKNNGNISHTAKELDINRNTLYRKMEKYGL